MLVVMNKCFLLNPEKKNLVQICLVVFEKNAKNTPLFRLSGTMVSGSLKLTFNLLTVKLIIRVA